VVLRVIVDALSGLGAAHDLRDEEGNSLKLVHRDVSPHNIMVGRDGVSRLTDFGVAKAEDRLTHTRDGQVKGKLAYMAPEQASTGTSDPRSDLFSMGIILWECLTGRRLFRADSTAATLHKLLNDEIPPPSSVDPALSPFDPLLAKALDREPAKRFQNADEFIDSLERVAAATGGLGSLRKVSRAVERYAAAKLEKDRRLIDEAIRTLKSAESGQGFDADGVSEPSVLSAADISVSSSSLSMSKLSGVYAHATSPGMQVRQRRSTLSGMGAGAPPLQVPPPAPPPLGYAGEASEPSSVHSASSSWARRFAWIAAVCLAAVLGWLFASEEPSETVRVVEVPVEAAPPVAATPSPPAQPTSPAAAPVEPQAPSVAPTEAPGAKVQEPAAETPSAPKIAPAAPPKRAVTRPRVKHPTTAPSTTPPKAESRPAAEKKPETKPETKPAPGDSTPFIPNPYKN